MATSYPEGALSRGIERHEPSEANKQSLVQAQVAKALSGRSRFFYFARRALLPGPRTSRGGKNCRQMRFLQHSINGFKLLTLFRDVNGFKLYLADVRLFLLTGSSFLWGRKICRKPGGELPV